MKIRLLFTLFCASALALACSLRAESTQMTIPLRDAQEVINAQADAQADAQVFVYFGKDLQLDELAGQKVVPLEELITRITRLAPEENLAPNLDTLTTRMRDGSLIAPKDITLGAVAEARDLLIKHNDQVTSDDELRSLNNQLEFYQTALEQDALTITVASSVTDSNRAPRPPLDTGSSSSTGPVGDTFAPATIVTGTTTDAWLKTGNTLTGTEVLGSINAQPVNFVVGSTSNVRMSISSGGVVSVVGGRIDEATGGSSPYIHKTGSYNFFAGSGAGNTGATGSLNNTGIGAGTMADITTGIQNTALGSAALANEQKGVNSVAIGTAALYNQRADPSISLDMYNTAVGYLAGYSITTGQYNTLLGTGAGTNITTGSSNIYLGVGIGLFGGSNESQTIRIGNDSAYGPATACYIAGIYNAPLGASNHPVYVDSDGKLGTTPSSRRYKDNIAALPSENRFMNLNPVTFTYKSDTGKTPQFGLIAEEVDPIYPELVSYNNDGLPETVKYQLLDGIFVREIQENRTRITTLRTETLDQVASLQQIIAGMQALIATMEARITTLEAKVAT